MSIKSHIVNQLNSFIHSRTVSVNLTSNESKEFAKSFRQEKAEQERNNSRRCNVILYRILESREVLAEKRNKEDVSFCEHFFNAFNVGFDRDDIRRVQRLGRRNDDSHIPVLVQYRSRHIKNLIMESLYKIKSMDTRFRILLHTT